jgi:alkylation response protein AidB-like acyl-CoA dehydrogenase
VETQTTPIVSTENELMEIAKELGPEINKFVEEEEKNRRLSPTVFRKLGEAGFHKLYLPKSLGGLEANPITTARLVEQVASFNAAAGWSMMVANTTTWWCSRFSDAGIEEIYKNGPDTIIAGTAHPPMKATPVIGGYKINGRTPLASNINEADWIFVTAFVMDGDKMKIKNGMPEIIGLCMKAEDCEIVDTWYTLGMRATDSNDVTANDVFVKTHLTYPMDPEFEANSYYKGKLYQFAAMGASVAALIVPVALAIAQNAVSEVVELASKKVPMGSMVPMQERGTVQRKLAIAKGLIEAGRAYLHTTLTEKWNKTLAGQKLSLEDKTDLLLSSAHTNQSCVQAVDLMYSAAGTSAIYSRSRLERHFRDAQVVRHHGFANENRYETAGQVYFGLEPDFPLVAY